MSHLHRIILLTSAFIILSPVLLTAQPGAPPATPIDGGLSLLLAAGGAYGIKKMLKNKK
ncbi:MAG: PID-CTERM protein-sorting domain-containing protein [Ekhidna sp.]